MGDRGNIVLCEGEDWTRKLYLCTHWSGSNLKAVVSAALKRGRDRWTDRSYIQRIIFSELVKDNILENTGFGLDWECGDGEDNQILVNVDVQKVRYNRKHYSFEEFAG